MKTYEFINELEKKSNGKDYEIEFLSYEWDDDLESMSYHKIEEEKIVRRGDTIKVFFSR